MALTVAALQDAAALDTMSAERLSRRTELALTVGTPDDDHLLSVLGLADQIMTRTIDGVHRAYVGQGARTGPRNDTSLFEDRGDSPHRASGDPPYPTVSSQ